MSIFNFLLEGEAPQTGGLGSVLPLVLGIGLIVVFFIFSSSKQKKRDRAESAMRDSLAIGDEVTTIGGIIGKVVSIKGETFVLETTKDKTKIRFLKGAIRSVDVKAADIASAIATEAAKADDAIAAEATEAAPALAEEAKPSKRAAKKAKKQEADVAAEAATEAPAEEVKPE